MLDLPSHVDLLAAEPAPAAPPKRLSEVAPTTAPAAEAPPAPPRRPQPRAAEPVAAAVPPRPANAPADSSLTLEQFASMWPAVLEGVKAYSKVAWATLNVSRPISLSDGVLAVAVDSPGKVTNLKASGHDERLRQAILDVLKADVKIDIVLAPERAGSGVPSAPSAAAVADSDAPSLDDANVDAVSGVDLALRELGATQIGEIEH
jgi:DNA polymerase-3 subunit gamma/tau